MSFWSRIIDTFSGADYSSRHTQETPRDGSRYAFVDAEVGIKDHRIRDVGALRWDGAVYHSASKRDLTDFLKDVDFVCGHNIINHDAKYLFGEDTGKWRMVDTLYVSPLLFPEHP